ALESVLPRMRDGRQAFFLFLPEGEDPDTLVRAEGRTGFEARIAQALPLSEYFYSELSRDVNTATLDGRARLAEHAKPLLAKLPDGAFRDLMYAELEKRTGVRGDASHTVTNVSRRASFSTSNTPRRTLVRSAIAMLLAEPALALECEPPFAFAALDKPGVPLLIELLELARARPGVNAAILLEQAGMLSSGERGNSYDRFRERLMFPIMDRRGRVIAFGGRVVEKPGDESRLVDSGAQEAPKGFDGPKYLNSPETSLFHKGRELFALWQVRQANTKLERLLVVEGYMDAIALHEAGLTQAVATLGTATTHEHAELLFRAAPDVVFCFDGDRAGRSAAWRALESVLPRMRDGRQAFFLFLPEGEDPDTLVRAEGRAGFEARIAQALPLSGYFYSELSRDVNTGSLDGRARLAEHAKPLLAKFPDGAFRDLMYAELEKRTGVRSDASHVVTNASRRASFSTSNVPRPTLVRSAIAMLLAEPALALECEPPFAFATLEKPGVTLLIELLEVARARPGANTAILLEYFAQREEAAALQKLALTEFPGEPEALRVEFLDALRKLDEQTVQQRLDALIRQQGEGTLDEIGKQALRELLARKGAQV
ncbi:MAG: toprim domain-containing protein, partial [Rhodanobacteraceae bacterium]